MIKYFNYLFLLTFALSCSNKKQFGFLKVESIKDGNFEIYRTSGISLSEITAEEIGNFNQNHRLEVGNYLILADCSHKEVIIYPDKTVTLIAQEVEFLPPKEFKNDDLFSIQCMRYQKLQLRQFIKQKLNFQVLSGKHEIFAGIKSLSLNFDEQKFPKSQKHVFKLGAISVQTPQVDHHPSMYFISPTEEQIALTQPQYFDKWQFLLPGDYWLMLNGSKTKINLKEGEIISILPSLIRVETPPQTDLKLAAIIKRKPLDFTINAEHNLNLNLSYPILPGEIKVRLNENDADQIINAVSGELHTIKLKSLMIDLGCSPWDWTCLGSKEVLLFRENEHYPFLQNSSDIPILHNEKNIYASLLGSHGIRHKIPEGEHITLKTGTITIKPKIQFTPGVITDLARVEANSPGLNGFTLDIPFDKITHLTLFEGEYSLVYYISSTNKDGERNVTSRKVSISQQQSSSITFPYFVSKKKWTKYLEDQENSTFKKNDTFSIQRNIEQPERSM